MKRTKKFLQRFISVVVCCVIVSSFFIVGASADTFVPDDLSQDTIGLDVEKISLTTGDSSDISTDVVFTRMYDDLYRYEVKLRTRLEPSLTYTFKVYLNSNESRFGINYDVLGSYELYLMRNNIYRLTGKAEAYRFGPDSSNQNASNVLIGNSSHSDPFPMCRISYVNEKSGSSYSTYYSSFDFKVIQSTSSFYFYLSKVNFKFIEPLPDIKDYVGSVGSFFSFILDKTKDAFTSISETPALAIFCIGFVVLGFVLAWLRKLIVNSS